MSLVAGARLGPYEIVAPAGAGGMGEVYRARDTRLDRTVAIKVLPASLAGDPDLRERFEREARAISSLQHPHICALFDVGEAPSPFARRDDGAAQPLRDDTTRFLVLEFLEGETLASRIARAGAVPMAEAMKIAIEICDALAAAHRAGIVHRDLKPGNVFLVRGTGGAMPTAKLLDFGLAKAATAAVAPSTLSMPTTPPTLTAQGTILGTLQYMAPEQIEGLEADARTDIFAFGALLYETLTARTAFDGQTRATLLGAILKDPPPSASAQRPGVPSAIDRIIAICLAKDPDARWQSARDLLHELQWVAAGGSESSSSLPPARTRAWRARAWIVAGVVLAAAVAAGMALAGLRQPSVALEPIQFSVPPPPDGTFTTPSGGGTGFASQAAVSPDGRHVVFVASTPEGLQLWLRPMNATEARPMAGTDGGAFPFWSPDSRFVGFFAGGKLKKVSVAGGPPLALCDAVAGRGGSWNRDNVIVFAPSNTGVLQRVSSAGGIPTDVSVLDGEYGESNHRFPWFLPDGRHFLYTAVVGTCCPATKPARVKLGVLDSPDTTPLLQVESSALYASGHVIFNRDGTLMAQPFDAVSRAFAGDPFPIAEAVASEGSRYSSVSASDAGVLVYARGSVRPTTRLTWFDRSGRPLGAIGDAGTYFSVSLSPDERRLAVSLFTGTPLNRDVWIIDAATGRPTRLTFDSSDDNTAVWAPDSERIAFAANRGGVPTLLQKPVSGVATEEALMKAAMGGVTVNDWSADGRYILYTQSQGTIGGNDVWVLPMTGDRKPFPYLQAPVAEGEASFSPDGKWVAYQSNDSGRVEIYVQPFPATGGKFQVSRNGGWKPIWRPDGRELYFLNYDSRLVAVPVTASGVFAPGAPVDLFPVTTMGVSVAGRQFAASRDGTRFLVNVAEQRTSAIPLTVVVNWLAAVQR